MNKALFICGSMNQTKMMHDVSKNLAGFESFFTPFYDDGIIGYLGERGLLESTILGNKLRRKVVNYLISNRLNIDPEKRNNEDYDLVFTSSDLIIPNNIRTDRIVLLWEGTSASENLVYYLVKYLGFPRYFAGDSAIGLSDAYRLFFVSSENCKSKFVKKGINPKKIVVATGMQKGNTISSLKSGLSSNLVAEKSLEYFNSIKKYYPINGFNIGLMSYANLLGIR